MGPVVSVIIPSYNHAAFVGECIQSVLDQSFADLEIVVTDDGSRDGTVDVIRRFSDPRIRLEVFPENRGAATAVNSTLRRAQGEFLCMLSSDDYFLPGKIEKQVAFLRANPGIGATFGLPRPIDERGAVMAKVPRWLEAFSAPFDEGLRSRPEWLRRFYLKGNCLCHPTAMVRRSVFDEIGEFDPRLASLLDFDLWVRLCAVREIHVMRDELTAVRMLDANRNMSADRRDTRLRSALEALLIRRRYLQFPRVLLDEIFAPEIAAHPAWAGLSTEMLLVEVAVLIARPAEMLLALDLMLDESSRTGDYLRLYELTGSIDPFGVEVRRARQHLQTELAAARADVAKLQAELQAARGDSAGLASAIEELRLGVERIKRQSKVYRLAQRFGGVDDTVEHLQGVIQKALARLAQPRR